MADTYIETVSNPETDQGSVIPGFVSKVVQCLASGLIFRNLQLVVILPNEEDDTERDEVLGVARVIQW